MIVSDNGPQFTAKEYQKFTIEWGIKYTTSCPYYPQSNGLAEKSMQIIKRMWNKAMADYQDLYVCLRHIKHSYKLFGLTSASFDGLMITF